jgi:small-conductance mechanosensitive channel
MSNHIINYSSSITRDDLILHTKITLGYDVPWRKVHETLIDAAGRSENVMASPAPFVLQTSLDDYYVSYELNVYTNKPHLMSKIYSELHQNIQDTCNENGIEILSPRYDAIRDGNKSTMPEEYLGDSYETPGFGFFNIINDIKK